MLVRKSYKSQRNRKFNVQRNNYYANESISCKGKKQNKNYAERYTDALITNLNIFIFILDIFLQLLINFIYLDINLNLD